MQGTNKYYFTFGFGQPHENGFYIIRATDYGSARSEMFRLFGDKWAFQYSETEWFKGGISQQEKYGLHEVK